MEATVNGIAATGSASSADRDVIGRKYYGSWRRLGLVGLHVWIAFHFVAVIVAPASVPPAAPLAQNAWRFVGGYLQLIFMNHGYHFFAPEPSSSALIEYEATTPDGTRLWSRIPNHDIWPRLNYHRHFMLTEHMAAEISARPELEPLLCKTYADEIARQTGASRIVLYQVQHNLSTPAQVRAGRRLDDPVTFLRQATGEFVYPGNDG